MATVYIGAPTCKRASTPTRKRAFLPPCKHDSLNSLLTTSRQLPRQCPPQSFRVNIEQPGNLGHRAIAAVHQATRFRDLHAGEGRGPAKMPASSLCCLDAGSLALPALGPEQLRQGGKS